MVNEQEKPLPIVLVVTREGKVESKLRDMINNKLIAGSYDIQIITLEDLRVRTPNPLDLVVFDEIAEMRYDGRRDFAVVEKTHQINHKGKGPRNKWGGHR